MPEHNKIAAVFGGTGFIGTQIVRELAAKGYRVKVLTRVPERAYDLKPCGSVGQVVPTACDYNDEVSIETAMKGADVVVNLVGVLFEKKRGDFDRAHVQIPSMIAKACAKKSIDRFVHVSALGIDVANSNYAKTKCTGEEEVLKHFPNATILRPSALFGPDDDFFNMFAELSRFSPILPLVGGGKTKFQPVFVGDVADAVMKSIEIPLSGDTNPQGKVYELGGPEVMTFKEIYKRLFYHTGRTRTLLPLSYGIAKVQGCAFTCASKVFGFITGYTPKPLLTADQIESLKTDNIVQPNSLGFQDLGITPTAMDAILATYLKRFKPGGRFGDKKAA